MRWHTSKSPPDLMIGFVKSKQVMRVSLCRVLERIGARALSAHLRKLCDYLAYEFASGQHQGKQNINKLVDAVNSLMWKYNVVTIDRLVLCLVSWTKRYISLHHIQSFHFDESFDESYFLCRQYEHKMKGTRHKFASILFNY